MLAKHGCIVDLEYVTRNVRIKAAQLLRDRCIGPAYYGDGADIEQELWLTYLATAHTFDASRASFHTFVSHVLGRAAAAIARRCKRPQPTAPQSSGEYFLTDNSEAEAVDHVLETLPTEAREICRRLRDGQTPAAIARELNLSRRQLRKTIDLARPYFEQAGFQE